MTSPAAHDDGGVADRLAGAAGHRGDHRAAAGQHLLGQRDAERLDEVRLRLGGQRVGRAAAHQQRLLVVVDVGEEDDPVVRRGRRQRTCLVQRRAGAGDDQLHPVPAARSGVRGDQVVDALGPGHPGQEQHVAVALQAAPGQRGVHRRRVQVEVGGRVDRRVADRDPARHCAANRVPQCRVDLPRPRRRSRRGCTAETATTSSLARNVVNRTVAAPNRPSRRQDRITLVTSEPTALAIVCTSVTNPAARAAATASTTTCVCGARYIDRHVVGTGSASSSTSRPVRPARCARPAPGSRRPAPGRSTVMPGLYGSSRSSGLSGSPAACSALDRPGQQADVVEAAGQRDLGEVAGLAGMAADHRVGPDDDDEPAAGHGHGTPPFASVGQGRRPDPRAPSGDGSGPELQVQPAAAVHVRAAEVGRLQRLAVERGGLHVLRRRGRARCRRRRSGCSRCPLVSTTNSPPPTRSAARAKAGALTRKQALPGDREQPQRRPDVPGAEAAGVVVAGQPARSGAELPGQRGVHDLGRAVGAAGVVVGPRRLHVGLVVQPLEPVQRVPGGHLRPATGARPAGSPGRRAEAEEAVEHGDERRRRRRPARSARAMSCSSRNE